MSRYGSSRRRNQNRAAMLIVVISAVCMTALMVLFFSIAMRQEEAPTVTPTESTALTDSIDRGAPTDSGAADVPEPTPPETDAQQTSEPPVTEAPAPTTEAPVQTEAPKPAVTPDSIPTFYDETLLAEVALPEGTAPDGYADKLVFYGDSTTHGMKAYKVFGSRDTKQVWTPTSGTLALFRAATDLVWNPNTQSEMSLADLCKTEKPEYLIMTLGVNGVSMMDETWFKTDYQSLIDIILQNSPDTKLILPGIFLKCFLSFSSTFPP